LSAVDGAAGIASLGPWRSAAWGRSARFRGAAML